MPMLTTRILAALVLLIVAGDLRAQEPAVSLAAESWDFGALEQGHTARTKIRIDNPGTSTLRLKRAKTNCGCLKARLSAEAVEPGKSAELILELATDRLFGKLRYIVFLDTNVAESARLIVNVEGEVRAPWWLSTRNLQFGAIAAGTGAEAQLRISVRAGEKTTLKRVIASAPYLEVDRKPFGEADEEHGWDVVVRLKKNAPVGPLEAALVVETDDPRSPVYEVTMAGEVVGPLTLSTPMLRFGKVPRGKKRTLTLTLVSSADPFTVKSVTCADERVSIAVVSKENERAAILEVTINGKGKSRRVTAMIRIDTDVPVQPRVDVRCIATIE